MWTREAREKEQHTPLGLGGKALVERKYFSALSYFNQEKKKQMVTMQGGGLTRGAQAQTQMKSRDPQARNGALKQVKRKLSGWLYHPKYMYGGGKP